MPGNIVMLLSFSNSLVSDFLPEKEEKKYTLSPYYPILDICFAT